MHWSSVSEPFLESVPQVHILFLIWVLSDEGSCDSPINGLRDPHFIITFVSSVINAAFGISKFLRSGPCRFIRSDTFLMGFGTLSYLLLFLNIATTLVAKGLSLVSAIDPDDTISRLPLVSICFVPQLAMVSSLLGF